MDRLIVLPQHGLELIDVAVVLLFLKCNIDNGFGDVVIHLLELFGLLDEHSELLSEVDLIVILSHLHQYFFFEELHGPLHDVVRPGCVLVLLVEVDFLHQVEILLFYLFEELLLELVFIFVELDNGAFHPRH